MSALSVVIVGLGQPSYKRRGGTVDPGTRYFKLIAGTLGVRRSSQIFGQPKLVWLPASAHRTHPLPGLE